MVPQKLRPVDFPASTPRIVFHSIAPPDNDMEHEYVGQKLLLNDITEIATLPTTGESGPTTGESGPTTGESGPTTGESGEVFPLLCPALP